MVLQRKWLVLFALGFAAYAYVSDRSKPVGAGVQPANTIPVQGDLNKENVIKKTEENSVNVAPEDISEPGNGGIVGVILDKIAESPEGRMLLKTAAQETNRQNNGVEGKGVRLIKMNYLPEDVLHSIGAQCGERVDIEYNIFDQTRKYVLGDQNNLLKTSFIVGSGEVPKALSNSIIATKENEKFVTAIAVEEFAKDYKALHKIDTNIAGPLYIFYDVKKVYNKIKPKFDMKIFEAKNAKGDRASCSDTVMVSYKLHKLDGEVVEESKPDERVKVEIGDSRLPYAVNKILERMTYNSERTAIIPPEYMTNVEGKKVNFIKNTKIPEKQILILDLTLHEKL